MLIEDSGEQLELLVSDLDSALMEQFGGPVGAALHDRRVRVLGVWEQTRPDAPASFRVSAIELIDPPPVTGSQPWVTLLCRFADAPDEPPYPVSHYENMMGSAYPGMAHYWKEVSYGNLDLADSVVVGWYELPQPHSYYASWSGDRTYYSGEVREHCMDMADADVFFPDFYGINFAFYDAVGLAGGAPLFIMRDGQTHRYGSTRLLESESRRSSNDHSNYFTWAHEMGHAFDLPHSGDPYGNPYGSAWDVMSGGGATYSLEDFGLGNIGVHPIAYYKDRLGWIPSERKYVAPPGSIQTLTLERLAQPGPEGYLMAQIPIGESRTDFYTVEARRFAGYDNDIPDEAVVIHKVDTTRHRSAQVVDVDNNGDVNDGGAMWTPGEIFTDSENGIQVSIESASSTGYQVTINTNPATFTTTCIQWLSSLTPLFRSNGGRASIELLAPSTCQWTVESHAPWLTLTAGSSGRGKGSVFYAFASNTSLTTRTGTLTIDGQTVTVTQMGVGDPLSVWSEDDMENRGSFLGGGLTSASSHSGTYAWTDSPEGNYQNDQVSWLSIPSSYPIDLTGATSPTLTFWHRYDFASGDKGTVYACVHDFPHFCTDRTLRVFAGSQTTWHQESLDLSPFVGTRINVVFRLDSDASGTADGWYIDDVAVFGPVPPPASAVLENPSLGSFQSGVGVISGWACEAEEIIIELDGIPLQAGYGTTREDTRSVCGDANNGFSLLWNWNNLGAGTHTVRALIDGVEFANTTVQVTTFGEEPFPRGWSGTFDLPDFPTSGETAVVRWEESLQNFVITDGQPNTGGGYNRVAGIEAILGNPSLGSAQSGVGVISGWACEAEEIVIELDGMPLQAAYGTVREDTRSVCGDADNGFSLLWNWNNLGPGTHTVRALLDGVEFANTTVRVTTFGEDPFPRGLSGTFPIPDFPRPGENKKLRWEQSLQNFVIIP